MLGYILVPVFGVTAIVFLFLWLRSNQEVLKCRADVRNLTNDKIQLRTGVLSAISLLGQAKQPGLLESMVIGKVEKAQKTLEVLLPEFKGMDTCAACEAARKAGDKFCPQCGKTC